MADNDGLGVGREADLPAGRLRYRDRGTGRPVVLLHGLLVNGDLWRDVVPPLAADHRCVTPDLPLGGHRLPFPAGADLTLPGLARLVADLLEALDLRDVVLVGNDTGGAIAQLVAVTYPERLGAVVLSSCDAFENFLPPRFRLLQRFGPGPGVLWLTGQLMRARRLRALPMAFGLLARSDFPAEVARSYFGPLRHSRATRADARAALRGIDTRYTIDAAARLGALRVPVLLAWAADDRVFPPGHADRLAALLADARVVLIPDSLALVPEDQPAALVAAVRAFLVETAVLG